MAVHLETNTFRLDDVQGFQVVPKFENFITLDDEVWEEVKSRCRRRDTSSIRVIQRSDVKRMRSRRGRRQPMFFFLFVDVRIVSGEVNVNDFPSCDIDDRNKVLCKNQGSFRGGEVAALPEDVHRDFRVPNNGRSITLVELSS